MGAFALHADVLRAGNGIIVARRVVVCGFVQAGLFVHAGVFRARIAIVTEGTYGHALAHLAYRFKGAD